MKKYSIRIVLINRMILFLIVSVLLINSLAIITYVQISKNILPSLIFIISLIICFVIGKKILQKEIELYLGEDSFWLNKKEFKLGELESYNFDNTNYIYKAFFQFSSIKLRMYLFKKNNQEYLKFKKDISTKIKLINKNKENKIKKYDWYLTKSAKVYGYFMIILMLVWLGVILYFPEKFKWSNFGLFLLVIAGISPILLKIFNRENSNE